MTPFTQGLILPESVLETSGFAVLAAFVAINSAMYVTLAILKLLPRWYARDFLPRRYRRSETRSIHPDAPPREPAEAARQRAPDSEE